MRLGRRGFMGMLGGGLLASLGARLGLKGEEPLLHVTDLTPDYSENCIGDLWNPAGRTSSNMQEASLTTYYNKLFMAHLAKNIAYCNLTTYGELPPAVGSQFRNLVTHRLPGRTGE